MAHQTHELRLIINKHDDNQDYTARWIDPDGLESPSFSLVRPLTLANLADLRWYLEEYFQFPGAGDRARAAGVEEKLAAWGEALFDAVFRKGSGAEIYQGLARANQDGRGCVVKIVTEDPLMLSQPWEMMRN